MEYRREDFDELDLMEEVASEHERETLKSAAARLEVTHASSGLSFTQVFHGGAPMQAYGHLAGERFYFRFRRDTAVLRVGPYDEAIEQLCAKRFQEQYEQRLASLQEHQAAGALQEADYRHELRRLEHELNQDLRRTPDDPFFIPTRVTREAVAPEVTGERYCGVLTALEVEELFTLLLGALKSFPPERQLTPYDRVWLYEGWEAAHLFLLEPPTQE